MATEQSQPEEVGIDDEFYSILFGGWAAGSFLLLVLGLTETGPYTVEWSAVAIAIITIVTFYYGRKV